MQRQQLFPAIQRNFSFGNVLETVLQCDHYQCGYADRIFGIFPTSALFVWCNTSNIALCKAL